MLAATIKPLALIFTLATSIGVLVHDTHIDKASVIAISAPAVIVTTYGLAHIADFKGNDPHTHTETATEHLKRMTTPEPRLHTRSTDDKKYLTPKKTIFNTGEDDQLFEVV